LFLKAQKAPINPIPTARLTVPKDKLVSWFF